MIENPTESNEGLENSEVVKLIKFIEIVGGELLDKQNTNLAVATKSDGSPVTSRDTWSERRLTEYIRTHFPRDSILGEEGTQDIQVSNRTWIIDPIDGTFPYEDGDPSFSISVGCDDIGILYFPAKAKLIVAIQGKGIVINGQMHVPEGSTKVLADARIGFEFTVDKPLKKAQLAKTRPINEACLYSQTSACATEDFRKLLQGNFDAILLAGASVYDLAAMLVIAQEANMHIQCLDGDLELVNRKDEKIPVLITRSKDLLDEIAALYKSDV